MYPGMYSSSWKTWFISCLFTPISLLIAYLIALAMRMPGDLRRTLGITTGTKSLALCLTIIAISFPRDEYLKYLVFPELHSIIMLAELAAFCAGYRLLCWFKKSSAMTQDESETQDNSGTDVNQNGRVTQLEKYADESSNGNATSHKQDNTILSPKETP